MTLWLRSNSFFNRFARIDDGDGAVVEVDRSAVPPDKAHRPDGNYDRLGGVFVGLFAEDGEAVARFGDRTIPLDEATAIHLAGPPSRRRLIVLRSGEPVLTLDYALADDIPREQDLTPFAEDEDFDFGLFLKNICETPHRRRMLIEDDPDC